MIVVWRLPGLFHTHAEKNFLLTSWRGSVALERWLYWSLLYCSFTDNELHCLIRVGAFAWSVLSTNTFLKASELLLIFTVLRLNFKVRRALLSVAFLTGCFHRIVLNTGQQKCSFCRLSVFCLSVCLFICLLFRRKRSYPVICSGYGWSESWGRRGKFARGQKREAKPASAHCCFR